MPRPASIWTPLITPVSGRPRVFPLTRFQEVRDEPGSDQGPLEAVHGQRQGEVGKLTDDLTVIAGRRDRIAGQFQERYGYEKGQAERENDDFARALGP
jgi:uncharacterized protein YjbJ (UPF0337 family)